MYILRALLLGVFIGGVAWLFLRAVAYGVDFLWDVFPARVIGSDNLSHAFAYPILICAVGGVIIGLFRRVFGDYPEPFEEVFEKIKTDKRYDPKKVPGIAILAFTALIFGGSVGPEAGLAGIISGLCYFASDRLKPALETGAKKRLLNIMILIGAGGCFAYLSTVLGAAMTLSRVSAANLGRSELIWFVPLLIFGLLAANLFALCGKLVNAAFRPLKKFPIVLAVLGGVLLGTFGVFFPLVMFSGEHEMGVVATGEAALSPVMLLAIGGLKLILISICLKSGWKGGNIFPIAFAGLCLAFGFAALTGADSGFAAAVVIAALCGSVLRKPLVTIMIFPFFFPVTQLAVIFAVISAGVASRLPLLVDRKK